MPPKHKPRRELSAYNVFMSKKVPEFREKYPDLPHRTVFAKAAEAWRKSPENPDNRLARMKSPPSSSKTQKKRKTSAGAASSSNPPSSRKL